MVYSVIFGEISTILGLTVSYYANLKPGGTIVIIGVIILLIILSIKKISNLFIKKSIQENV